MPSRFCPLVVALQFFFEELEPGHSPGAFVRTLAPVLAKISPPMPSAKTQRGRREGDGNIKNRHDNLRQGIPFSFAKRTASSELWGPISCTLLRAAWQAHAECAPRIGQADLGDTPSSCQPPPGVTVSA